MCGRQSRRRSFDGGLHVPPNVRVLEPTRRQLLLHRLPARRAHGLGAFVQAALSASGVTRALAIVLAPVEFLNAVARERLAPLLHPLGVTRFLRVVVGAGWGAGVAGGPGESRALRAAPTRTSIRAWLPAMHHALAAGYAYKVHVKRHDDGQFPNTGFGLPCAAEGGVTLHGQRLQRLVVGVGARPHSLCEPSVLLRQPLPFRLLLVPIFLSPLIGLREELGERV